MEVRQRQRGETQGLITAQDCLPDNVTRDRFASDFSVLALLWEALSPDACLMPYITDYKWLSKELLALAKEVVEAEKEVDPVDEQIKAKAALSELFAEVKGKDTPLVVERIVNDIDEIVKTVRFPGWQTTKAGEREVQKALRKVIYVKYKIKD